MNDDKDVRKDYGPRGGATSVVAFVVGMWIVGLALIVGAIFTVHG